MEEIWTKGDHIYNLCPRAYFKCSFTPSCTVKKKVKLITIVTAFGYT